MKIKNTKYKNRSYLHFDKRISFIKGQLPRDIVSKVENPHWVKTHGFYPFVKYTKNSYKIKKEKEVLCVEKKPRGLMYCSHIDRFIFQHYAYILNAEYNKKLESLGIDMSSTAYRKYKDQKSKSNIVLAKEVYDFISKQNTSLIYVTDFTGYFDNISHELLLENLKYLLNTERLSDDLFYVIKNITNYCYSDYKDIFEFAKSKNPTLKITAFKERESFFQNAEDEGNVIQLFKEFKKIEYNLKLNKKDKGIPQGSPISAVLSNIYLIKFDYNLSKFAEQNGGVYRRYCDDIMVVIPLKDCSYLKDAENAIKDIIFQNSHGNSINSLVEINEKKTKMYLFQASKFYEVKANSICFDKETFVDYLGFCFNGKQVSIRQKSISNYYKKMYKQLKIIKNLESKYGRKVYRRKFYKKFTHLGAQEKGNNHKGCSKYGNFITYTQRAHNEFIKDELIGSCIKNQIKGHWAKIQNELK